MKIVFLQDWFLYYVTELSNAMAEEHEVLFISRDHSQEISPSDAPVPVDHYLRQALNPRIERTKLRYRRRDLRGLLEVVRLHRRMKKWGAEVLHVQATSDWRIVLLAVLNRHRLVVTIHDIENHPGETHKSRGLLGFLYRRLFRSAKKLVVHGEALRKQLQVVSPELTRRSRVTAIPHGVFSLYRTWDDPAVQEEPYTVLFFGRIAPYKGLEDLIAAQPRVTAAVPEALFVIAGSGRFEPYRQLIREPGVFEIHNRFIPNSEVPRLFRRAAIVVLPYVEASQSGVIPIAYDYGKPVVATRVGSLPEVVEEQSGILVDPGRPEQLAEAIISLLKDPERRRLLGEGARLIGQTRLSWKNIAAQTARMYTEGAHERKA